VAVIGLPDTRWGEAVTAIVIPQSGRSISEAELVTHCRTLIAGYKCPKRIHFVDDLPRVPSGKINKVALRQQYAAAAGKPV
jgi:acyl-CoA synthetase (AMP-forming)/AMP-acid ligase II